MATPIGFLTVGSFVRKGGHLMQVIDIDKDEITVIGGNDRFITFDTQVLDLQDVKAA